MKCRKSFHDVLQLIILVDQYHPRREAIMKIHLAILTLFVLLLSCEEKPKMSSINQVDWENRYGEPTVNDSLTHGSTYLSVYSEIYSRSDQRTHNLTATVSMRNTSKTDTIYIKKAEYFDTHGSSLRTYFEKTIFIAPMATVEIIIDEKDESGGTGANFIFEWITMSGSNEPLFEAVMISTTGQQGLSFSTQGQRLDP